MTDITKIILLCQAACVVGCGGFLAPLPIPWDPCLSSVSPHHNHACNHPDTDHCEHLDNHYQVQRGSVHSWDPLAGIINIMDNNIFLRSSKSSQWWSLFIDQVEHSHSSSEFTFPPPPILTPPPTMDLLLNTTRFCFRHLHHHHHQLLASPITIKLWG